ncbi:MAG: DNA-binding protein [Thermoplasmata archaeon]|nr:MAG: DNA-binding protein [Thermoplasmata archaeon]
MFKREGNIVMAKFVEGDVIDNLKDLMQRVGGDSAVILNGIGMLEHARIGYFTGERYMEETLKEPAELVSLQGNIGKHGDTYVVHAHVALACSDHMLRGGHLMGGRVKVVNEIALHLLEELVIERVKEENLMVMELRKR